MRKAAGVTLADDTSKLLALERARQRLEVALADDEGWRALRRLDTTPDLGAGEAARLEILLLSNPLYRAWKNLNAAIEAKQSGRPPASSPPAVSGAQAGPGLGATAGADFEPEAGGAVRRGGACPSAPAAADLPARAKRPASALQHQVERAVAVRTQEASVSFIMRGLRQRPALAARAQREAERRQPRLQEEFPPPPNGAVANPEGPLAPVEEAEVAVVSVAARRHAGTVERLLRALHGQED
jgi:hypothetical protein